MRSDLLALCAAQVLLLGACAGLDNVIDPGRGNPPIGHHPGKADLFLCTASDCDLIPVNIQVEDGRCTVPFLFEKVRIQPGLTARFAFAVLTPEFMFRFTDQRNDARTRDPARNLPAIEIDYRGMPPAFTVGYGDPSSNRERIARRSSAGATSDVAPSQTRQDARITTYDVTALPGAANRYVHYRFRIHAEWSADHGATWMACEEKDPVIAND